MLAFQSDALSDTAVLECDIGGGEAAGNLFCRTRVFPAMQVSRCLFVQVLSRGRRKRSKVKDANRTLPEKSRLGHSRRASFAREQSDIQHRRLAVKVDSPFDSPADTSVSRRGLLQSNCLLSSQPRMAKLIAVNTHRITCLAARG